ncbi:MAG: holo-ACP synthase [Dehalococcoidia bacterium]
MEIVGHGLDIVELSRIDHLEKEHGGDFLLGWFTEHEISHAPPVNRGAYFAGQIAAKEAIVKAIGTGLVGEMAWTEIEVNRAQSGGPLVVLTGSVLEMAIAHGVESCLLTISHGGNMAIASALALGRHRGPRGRSLPDGH